MPALLILAASLMMAPQPNPRMQMRSSDFPRAHLTASHSAAALLEIVVNPAGKIENCHVLSFDGNEALSNAMCRLQRPTSWRAATDEDGTPTYGVVRTLIRMTIPETPEGDRLQQMEKSPGIAITVQSLPVGLNSPFDVKIALKVDQSGKVLACRPSTEIGIPPALNKIACDHSMRQQIAPASGRSGPLAGFIIEQTVRFVASSPVPAVSN